MDWHPFCSTFDMLKGDAWESLKDSIAKSGGNLVAIVYRMANGVKQYLDGRNRSLACSELSLPCREEEIEVSDEDVPLYITAYNAERRHLTPENRGEVVAKLREMGYSLRKIAKAVGVSKDTILRDLHNGQCVSQMADPESESTEADTSAVSRDTPENCQPKITGQDGKKHPATKPEPLRCARCQRCIRVGQPLPKGCMMCRELRGSTKKKKKAEPSNNGDDESAPRDAFGNVIPKRCRDAYCDPWIQEAIDFLGVMTAQFWQKRLADDIQKRKKAYPFFNAKDFVDGCGFAGNYMEDLLKHLKDNRPAGVCPACKGNGCGHCRSSGLLPRAEYEQLKEEHAHANS